MLALLYFFVKLHMIFVQLYGIAVAKKKHKGQTKQSKVEESNNIYLFTLLVRYVLLSADFLLRVENNYPSTILI